MNVSDIEKKLARFEKESIYRNDIYGVRSTPNPYDKYIRTLETMEVRMNKSHPDSDKPVFGTIYYTKQDDRTYLKTHKFGKFKFEDKVLDDLDMRGEFMYIRASFQFAMVASIKINGEFIKEGF